MKIVAVETFLVPPRWLFCRIETDQGLVGWGEPVVEGRAETVRAAVDELSDLLIGRDPRRVEDLWQLMTKAAFYRGGPVLSSAVAGIDQALWDILGRSLGVPVHQLLGGAVRDEVRVYGWVGGDEPAEVADAAAAQTAAGLTAVKMNAAGRMDRMPDRATVRSVVDRLAAVREAIGDDRDVAVDFHGRFGVAAARRVIPELAPLHPMFVEEPVLPEYTHRLGDLVTSTTVPIACGERLFSRTDFLPALQAGIAVAQPDLSHAGGISEVRRIASLAETFDALLAPHCPLGPLTLAASLQVAFATPNFLIQEQSIGIHYHDGAELLDYVLDRSVLAFGQGAIRRWDAPGLGVEIDEAAVREADRKGHRWRPPVWRHDDGSFAEW
ncbi:galactonate dehydratase [Pseudonocardia nematodicida]|uniref:Galactonate dehydratase n=1 Tax=Pseudonocardia nematodicida TaxID=1206997 RepID=A0ABV1K3I7_9PSEU